MGLTVLHLCSLDRRNGTVHLASRLCQLLARRGHRVLLGAHAQSKLVEWTRGQGLSGFTALELRHGLHPLSLARDLRRLRRLIEEQEIDIVHSWMSAETYVGALAVSRTAAALVRSRTLDKPIRGHLARRWLDSVCSATFASCSSIEHKLHTAGGAPERIHRLVEGVDTQRFAPDPGARQLRLEHGIPLDAPLIVNVGRMEHIKGQVHFLEALARLPAKVYGWIAGDGRERPALEACRERLGLGQRVVFLGVRSDVARVLAASDLYALTSLGSEGSSRATLEALACGLPVVCSRVGMLPDIVLETHGRLVAEGDSAALAAAFAELLAEPTRLACMSRAARAYALAERSEEHMLASVESVYLSVAEQRQVRRG